MLQSQLMPTLGDNVQIGSNDLLGARQRAPLLHQSPWTKSAYTSPPKRYITCCMACGMLSSGIRNFESAEVWIPKSLDSCRTQILFNSLSCGSINQTCSLTLLKAKVLRRMLHRIRAMFLYFILKQLAKCSPALPFLAVRGSGLHLI